MGIFIPVACVQGIALSYIAKPLEDDAESAKMSGKDYLYVGIFLGFIALSTGLALMIGR